MINIVDTLSIGAIARLTGLTLRQIRYLDKHLMPMFIDINGRKQRRYDKNQLEQLLRLAKLRKEGYELGAAIELSKRINQP